MGKKHASQYANFGWLLLFSFLIGEKITKELILFIISASILLSKRKLFRIFYVFHCENLRFAKGKPTFPLRET